MQNWKLTVDPLRIDHWSAPRINKGDHLFTWKWKLTVDPLCINHQSAPSPQDQQRWSPFHAKVKVDCWSSPHRSSTPPLDQQRRFIIFNTRMIRQSYNLSYNQALKLAEATTWHNQIIEFHVGTELSLPLHCHVLMFRTATLIQLYLGTAVLHRSPLGSCHGQKGNKYGILGPWINGLWNCSDPSIGIMPSRKILVVLVMRFVKIQLSMIWMFSLK